MISTDLRCLADMLRARAIVADRLAPAELLAVSLHLECLAAQCAQMEAEPIPDGKREPVTLRVVVGGVA